MSFQKIYDRAAQIKGEKQLVASLPKIKSVRSLKALPDADYLAEMTKCVFRSGFVWKIVENKWSNFETVFANFNPKVVASFSDERLETIAQDASIIRNFTKILAARTNAAFILDEAKRHQSFANMIATWPEEDLVGLLRYLKEHGARLGGHTGQYFLRFIGKDTFILSKDVVRTLIEEGITDKEPTSKSGLKAVQEAFNSWREESGLPYSHISRIMAASHSD